jgi:magnesium transporter
MATPQVRKEEQLNLETVNWGNLTWVNIEYPTEREIGYLAQNYHFHPLDLEDCLSRRQQPKLDVYEDYLFLIFPFSVWDKATRVSRRDQVSVFIGDNYLITIHDGLLKTLVSLFRQCQTDEGARQENLSQGSGCLLYRILDRTIDSYFPVLSSIVAWVEDVEDAVFDENVESAQEVATMRRDIITQRRIFNSVRPVFAALENKIKRFCKIDLTVQFGDLMDHVNKICETLDEYREIVDVFKDTDFVLSTDRLNRIMRILTIIATIVLPYMVASSIYGMNIHMPGSITTGSWVPFIIIMLVMTLVSGVTLYIFHRRRWI